MEGFFQYIYKYTVLKICSLKYFEQCMFPLPANSRSAIAIKYITPERSGTHTASVLFLE